MKTKRKFTAEYKTEAVRLVLQEKLSTPEAARRLEMSDKTLANWVRLAQHGQPLNGSLNADSRKLQTVTDLEMEVLTLRVENARLKMEKEILKMATAFLVKQSQ